MKKIAVLGFGGRGNIYAHLCKERAKDCEVVAIIDNSQDKLNTAQKTIGIDKDHLFLSLDAFLNAPKEADWLFVCTQDKDHIEHAVKGLQAGYNLLLEKPVATTLEDCLTIEKTAKACNRQVAVCHVLRYSVYYDKIKEMMESGILGQIIAIDQVENVAYWHYAHSYVRGDWRRADESTPMILAKCCHDLDIAVYLANSKCQRVTSQGQLNFFKKENAPAGATQYCLDGCKAKATCPYDCEKIYIDTIRHKSKRAIRELWPQSRLMKDGQVTRPKLYEAMHNTRYGQCVFLCDNDVVDYQVTTMLFENGINATLTMTAYAGPCYRETRIRGTMGELICNMGENSIILDLYGKKKKRVPLHTHFDAHGGGDARLIQAFDENRMKTDISLSIESHIIGFAAEYSRVHGSVPVQVQDFRREHSI